MASTLHYLTVQDVLWINLQATKKVHHFSYARLEEATFYQYAYGNSNSLLPQAARFVRGFLKMHPLEAGNEVTAFIALMTFLRMNGRCISLSDSAAPQWFDLVAHGKDSALDSIAAISHPIVDHHHDGKPDIRGFIQANMSEYPETIRTLAAITPVSG